MNIIKSILKFGGMSIIISLILSLMFGFKKTVILDYFFMISLFIFIVNVFRIISNNGAYDFLEYSFYRTKKYFKFFTFHKDDEDDDNLKDIHEFLDSKDKKYSNVNIDLIGSIILLIIASISNICLYF